MRRRTNQVNGEIDSTMVFSRSTWRRAVGVAIVVTAIMTGCGPRERRAEKIYGEAARAVEQEDFESAVEKLEVILRDHPDTKIAERARDEIVVYRGLADAVVAFPGRRSFDGIVQIARALDRYKARRGSWPESLGELVPDAIAALPVDGWERDFAFERTAKGYRLACYGSDGVPGGDGDQGDIVVENGVFVRGGAR